MKKIILLVMVMLVIMSTQAVFAVNTQSYLRWIYWENEKSHIATQTEMAAIIDMISANKVKPDLVYTLATGVSFRIPKPDLYLEYLLIAIKKSDPSVVATQDAVEAVLGGDIVEWGNDLNYRVKNYYFSSKNNTVQYIDNYTGVESGTRFLLINGSASIKLDCGNPLEVIGDVFVPAKPKSIPVADSVVKETTPSPQEKKLTSQQALMFDIERRIAYRRSIESPEVNRRGWIKPTLITSAAIVVIVAIIKFVLPMFRGGGPGGAPTTPDPIVPTGGGPGGAPTTP